MTRRILPALLLLLVSIVTACAPPAHVPAGPETRAGANPAFPDVARADPADLGISLRGEPLRELEAADTVHVRAFGAVPDDGRVDTRAIQAAIDEAVRRGTPTVVAFEAGEYHLDAYEERYALRVEGAEDLVLEGNGARLIMTRPEILTLRTSRSRRVIVRGFEVDYQLYPHTQGWVTEVNADERWLKVRIDPAWPDPDMPHFLAADYKWAFIKDRHDLAAFKEGTEYRLYLQDWERVEEGIWLYHTRYASKLQTVEVGDPFVQISRVDGCLLSISDSEDVTLQSLRLYVSPACMLGSGGSSRVNYLDVDMSPRPGSWLSAGADGSYNANGREGPWVEGCRFDALGDDNLVIKGTGAYVVDVVDDSTFALVRARHRFMYPPLSFETYLARDSVSKWEVRPGDLLEIVDPLLGRIVSEPRVVRTDTLPNAVLVTTDRPVPGLRVGTSADSSLTVLNQSNTLPGFVVKNNEFRNAPRFGFLLKSHNGVVLDNVFVNHSDQSIAMINTYQEFGGRVYNILIQGNRFVGPGGWPVKTAETAQHRLVRPEGRDIFSTVTAAFTVPVGQWEIIQTDAVELRNLHFIGNEWRNWRQLPALTVMNAEGVTIRDNTFVRDTDARRRDPLWLGRAPIRILHSRNVEIGAQMFLGADFDPGGVRANVEVVDSENVTFGRR